MNDPRGRICRDTGVQGSVSVHVSPSPSVGLLVERVPTYLPKTTTNHEQNPLEKVIRDSNPPDIQWAPEHPGMPDGGKGRETRGDEAAQTEETPVGAAETWTK